MYIAKGKVNVVKVIPLRRTRLRKTRRRCLEDERRSLCNMVKIEKGINCTIAFILYPYSYDHLGLFFTYCLCMNRKVIRHKRQDPVFFKQKITSCFRLILLKCDPCKFNGHVTSQGFMLYLFLFHSYIPHFYPL